MIVSRSELVTFQACEMRYFYAYSLGLAPKDYSDAIEKGFSGHRLLQLFFEALRDGKSKEDAVASIVPEELDENSLVAFKLAKKFATEWPYKGKPLVIEEVHRTPLDGIQFGYTPDLVWEHSSGTQDIWDWKFTKRSRSETWLNMHSQLPGYAAYLNEYEGYNITKCKYVYLNTNNVDKPWYKIVVKTFSPEEMRNVARDQMKVAERLVELKEMPVAYQRQYVTRALDGGVCEQCWFHIPCKQARQGMDDSKTLTVMYEPNPYGYQE